jgi:hypothetical protein
MKRFWLILLSLGLVMAFSVSAFAVDVKVSGNFYIAGMYLNKTSLNDNTDQKDSPDANPSTAFFYQRLRVGTDFIVSPCLKLVTRFDALERIWGGTRYSEPYEPPISAVDSSETRSENENIAVDWAYINYVAPVGTFEVGIMNYGATGTIFGNGNYPAGRIKYYSNPIGSFNINADFTKVKDQSYSAVNTSASWTDADKDAYALEGVYSWKDGKAAIKGIYYRYADKRPGSGTSYNYLRDYFTFTPWTIFKIGPVNIQAELNWAVGDYKKYDSINNIPVATDVKLDNLSGWIDATANFAPVYAGATVAYVSGDDPKTTDKMEGGVLTGGFDWNPCLIMFNYNDVTNWAGRIAGHNPSELSGTAISATSTLPYVGNGYLGGPMYNAWFFQGRVGVKPTPQLDAMLSVSYAQADKKPTDNGKSTGNIFSNGTYGTEVDVTATYKITDNLSYMLGAGYLFTGDYFKGYDTGANKVCDDFILMNKLTLTF